MSRRKQRPSRGAPIQAGMSERDIAATGLSRRFQRMAKALANIPGDKFEELIEGPKKVATLSELQRIGEGKPTKLVRLRTKCCPKCGHRWKA